MGFDQESVQPVKNPTEQKKQGSNFNMTEAVISMLEHQTNMKMPEDREELFNNFDKYVPADLKEIMIATQPAPTSLDRNGIREQLEKSLFGSSLKEIDRYLDAEMGKFGKLDDEQEIAEYNRLRDASNNLTAGNFLDPLAHMEERVASTAGEDREMLRSFAQRLTREIYKNRPKMKVDSSDIQNYLNKEYSFLSRQSGELSRTDTVNYGNAINGAKKGEYGDALDCIENDIHFIQRNLLDLGKRDKSNEAQKILQERYGDNFSVGANKELEKLRNYREFLRGKGEGDVTQEKEKPPVRNEQQKEKLEGEELYKSQIENNSHPKAKSLVADLTLLMRNVDETSGDPRFLKEELSEILYRNDLEYTEGEDSKISEDDQQILGPILSMRREMDGWDKFDLDKKDNFQRRMIGYLKDIFGIETKKPAEGEIFDKKNMQAVKIEKTKNEFLDKKIKKVFSPGFEMNDKLFDYYKKWYAEKDRAIRRKWNDIKGTVSDEEFSQVMQEDRVWLEKHLFKKIVKPAHVEVYKHG